VLLKENPPRDVPGATSWGYGNVGSVLRLFGAMVGRIAALPVATG
jgi:hypothetical protein